MSDNPEVIRQGIFDCQSCVPAHYTDEEVEAFTNRACPWSTTKGWTLRSDEECARLGHEKRAQCEEREGYVHLMLEA